MLARAVHVLLAASYKLHDDDAATPLYPPHNNTVPAFSVTDDQNDCEQMFVFAADDEEADEVYCVWSELHLGKTNVEFNLHEVSVASFKGEYEQFAVAASHGATGVAGPCRDGYTILPTWDRAAGDL